MRYSPCLNSYGPSSLFLNRVESIRFLHGNALLIVANFPRSQVKSRAGKKSELIKNPLGEVFHYRIVLRCLIKFGFAPTTCFGKIYRKEKGIASLKPRATESLSEGSWSVPSKLLFPQNGFSSFAFCFSPLFFFARAKVSKRLWISYVWIVTPFDRWITNTDL